MQIQSRARLALIEVAVFWGLIWIGYRALYAYGMSAMSASIAAYSVTAFISFTLAYKELKTGAWRITPAWLLIIMMASSAFSTLGYTWGVVRGEVMQILLLFYLMPVWSILMAHFILKERTNRVGWFSVTLGFVGAIFMLYDPDLGIPFPKSAAEWAGLGAGFSSACLNITVKKTPQLPEKSRTFFLTIGTVVFGLMILPFESGTHLPQFQKNTHSIIILSILGVFGFVSYQMYQYGMKNLKTHNAVLILSSELFIAALSSWVLVNEEIEMRAFIGGLFIIIAGLISNLTDD